MSVARAQSHLSQLAEVRSPLVVPLSGLEVTWMALSSSGSRQELSKSASHLQVKFYHWQQTRLVVLTALTTL